MASASKAWLFHNDGDGTFSDATVEGRDSRRHRGGWRRSLAFIDVDHDADVDLVVTGRENDAAPQQRQRHVHRRHRRARPRHRAHRRCHRKRPQQRSRDRSGADRRHDHDPAEPARRRVQAARRVQAGRARAHARRRRARLRQGRLDGSGLHVGRRAGPDAMAQRERHSRSSASIFRPRPSPTATASPPSTTTTTAGSTWPPWASGANGGVLQVLRNVQGRFEDAIAERRRGGAGAEEPARAARRRSRQDNDTDLVVTQAQTAPPVLLRNDGGNANHAIRLALTGLNDNRSGVGTKVEVQAGATLAEVRDGVRVGLPRPELARDPRRHRPGDRGGRRPSAVADRRRAGRSAARGRTSGTRSPQIDRRGSSCPILFTWNGSTFEFVSDAIGPAVIGHWVAPGRVLDAPDTDEFVKVDGSKLRASDGRLSLHFIEPMEEINYLDQVRLFAVDHPDGTEIYPNEYFAAEPPFPADRTIATRDARLPQGAWDEKGRDLMPALRAADRRFVDTFADAPFKGFAALHALELDLGALRRRRARAPADARLHRLLHRDVDVRRRSGEREGHRPVRRSAARRRLVDARQRRHRLPRRPASHDGRGSDGQAAAGHAAHPHLDEPEDLLGPGAHRHDARRRDPGHADRGAARGCLALAPRLPARDPRHARGRHQVRLRRRQPVRGPTRGIAASTRSSAT